MPPAQPASPPDLSFRALEDMESVRTAFTRFMLEYQFGIEEITTKLEILQEEFTHLHDNNPIEHLASRLKSPQSILEKVARRDIEPSFASIRTEITDIAGVRVICSFVTDVYSVFDILTSQPDVTVRAVKDYIEEPKPNGYRSLHALLEVPVHLSDRILPVVVEVQLRTVAMDFWASLEHKIHYKYASAVPDELLAELTETARASSELDHRMELLHRRSRTGPSRLAEPSTVVPPDHVVAQWQTLQQRAGRED